MTCAYWTNQLTNRAQPAPVRVEAARRLARVCRTREVQGIFRGIAIEDDEDPVVRCAVVEELPAWGQFNAVNFLSYRVFDGGQVQAAAEGNA